MCAAWSQSLELWPADAATYQASAKRPLYKRARPQVFKAATIYII